MPNGKFVAYYRVSTNRQGQSGLGLEAQQESVRKYLNGGDWEVVSEFVEIESGKRSNRPKLLEALEICKRLQATLIIAKLDRLARNVHFISGLMEAGVDFIATDNPNANKLMLHLLAAFAEHEREQISQRTKLALMAAKKRGTQLGKNGKKLGTQNHEKSVAFAKGMENIILLIKSDGYTTLRSITSRLNELEIPTASGKSSIWHLPIVHRMIKLQLQHTDMKKKSVEKAF